MRSLLDNLLHSTYTALREEFETDVTYKVSMHSITLPCQSCNPCPRLNEFSFPLFLQPIQAGADRGQRSLISMHLHSTVLDFRPKNGASCMCNDNLRW